MPAIVKISTARHGAADILAYVATVDYGTAHGGRTTTTFVGSRHGGPVTFVTESGVSDVIDHAVTERCGRLSPRYIRRFYSDCYYLPGNCSDDFVTLYRGAAPQTMCGRHAQDVTA